MARYLAGVASALLIVVAGFLIWQSRAGSEEVVPDPPKDSAAASREPLGQPPSADKTREEKRFARYDEDEDGIITRVEMMETRRKPFQKLDTNGNGSLSFEEWAITTAEKFAKADADRSQTLNAAEFLTTKRETSPRKCAC